MFKRDQRPEPDRIDVTIGESATINGDIRCETSIRIDGVMENGSIETLGNVIIGPNARVLADIKAKTVSVSGAYKGDLTAQRVELLEGGRMWGTIRVVSFLLDEGAFMHGQLIMLSDETPEDPFAPAQPESQDDNAGQEAETPPPADDETPSKSEDTPQEDA
jgi:cytoskeletal protein CcmA (bactofilin family)